MGTPNDTIRLDRQETADFLSILSVHDRSASGRRLSPRIAEILESISLNGTVRLDLTPEPPTPDWAIEQPRDLDPDQGVFPLRYPSGFGHFPISLAFWDGPLRSNLLADGHATLEDLRTVRIGDFGFLSGIEAQVIEARKRVDAILAEKPIPPGGYRRLPSRLTLDMPALSLAEAISDYLPLWRRRTFRLALNVDGKAESLAEVARLAGVASTTPKDTLWAVFRTLSAQYDWRPSYEGLTDANGTMSERWLSGIHPNLRRHLGMIRKAASSRSGSLSKPPAP